jgi:CHASE3 domain sensor protein
MAGIGTLLNLLKYAPVIFEVVQHARQRRAPEPAPETGNDEQLAEIKQQLSAIDDEQDYLRQRLHDVSAALETLQVVVYVGGGLLIAFIIVLFILVLVRH